MSDFDSAWCLARFRRITGTGSNTADTDDDAAYALLSSAQIHCMETLAAVAPWSQMDAPQALSSSDGGYTYTLSSYPLAHFELYDGPTNGIRIYPVGYDSALDGYVLEGQTIRWPGSRARTLTNGLYARYVKVPASITALVEPVLRPAHARLAMCYQAASEWAHESGAVDPSPFDDGFRKQMRGDPAIPGNVGIIGSLQLQGSGMGLIAAQGGVNAWWRRGGPDFLR